MSDDAERRAEEMIHKLRKLKGFCPMTPEEADAAYDAVPADPISDNEIDSLTELVTSGGKISWEPTPDIGWTNDMDLADVEDEALQLNRNKGEDDGDTSKVDALRKKLLKDDEIDAEDRIDGGKESPTDGG